MLLTLLKIVSYLNNILQIINKYYIISVEHLVDSRYYFSI
nr:MAG TPA: hypothetical protein [Caudoviricetes sp.]